MPTVRRKQQKYPVTADLKDASSRVPHMHSPMGVRGLLGVALAAFRGFDVLSAIWFFWGLASV